MAVVLIGFIISPFSDDFLLSWIITYLMRYASRRKSRLVSPFTADAILSYNYYAIAQMIPRDLFPRL